MFGAKFEIGCETKRSKKESVNNRDSMSSALIRHTLNVHQPKTIDLISDIAIMINEIYLKFPLNTTLVLRYGKSV